jgi:hypothetical protein
MFHDSQIKETIFIETGKTLGRSKPKGEQGFFDWKGKGLRPLQGFRRAKGKTDKKPTTLTG